LATWQAIELARQPSLERLIGVSTALGTYALMRAGPKIAQRFIKPKVVEVPRKVEYVAERKAIIAEQIKEYQVDYESAREITTFYAAKPSKDIANAIFIQRETAGGLVRTIVTPEGRIITPPRGPITFEYGFVSRDLMTLGTGITPEMIPRDMPYGAYPIKEVVIPETTTIEFPFEKITKVGIILDEKTIGQLIQPADIDKTSLARTFGTGWGEPYPKPPDYFATVSKWVGGPTVDTTVVLKTAPIRIDTVKGTAVITGFQEIPRILPEPVPFTTVAPTKFREYQVQTKFPKQWEYTLPTGMVAVKKITEEQRRQRYLQLQKREQKEMQVQMKKEKVKHKLEERVTPAMKTIVVPEHAQAQLKREEQKQKQLEKQMQTEIQIPRQDIARIPKKAITEVPPPELILPKVRRGKKIIFKKPKKIRFYPYGKRRRKYKVIPRAGLLSLGTEMTESIKRGRFIYPKHPRRTKKVKKQFLRQLRAGFVGMEFPTEKMYKKGKELQVGFGKPAIESIMPQFRRKKRRRRRKI